MSSGAIPGRSDDHENEFSFSDIEEKENCSNTNVLIDRISDAFTAFKADWQGKLMMPF